MKKIFTGIVSLLVLATAPSCQQDAPEINFSHTTSIVSDFSGIIKAINDLSLGLTEKLEIIDNAIRNQTLTLSQKIDILNAAIEKGILTFEQMAQKTVDAIDAMNVSLTAKLAAVEGALTDMNTSLTTKLGLIEATMKTGLKEIADSQTLIEQAIGALAGTMEERLTAIQGALTDLNTSLDTKLGALEAAVNAGFVSLSDELALTKTALVNSLTEGFAANAESLAAVNKALSRLAIDEGIYGGDDKSMYISPAAWSALQSDPEMYAAFMNSLTTYSPEVTTSQVSSHTCVINISLKNYDQIELLSKQTVYNANGVSKPAYRIVRMYSRAEYIIDKGACGLGCYEINITDVAGTTAKYNFQGAAGGTVELEFWDGANNFVLEGHVEVVMR